MTDFNERCDEILAMSDLRTNKTTPVGYVEESTISEAVTKTPKKYPTQTITATDVVLKDISRTKTQTITINDSDITHHDSPAQSPTEQLTATAVLTKRITKYRLAQTITATAVGVKDTHRSKTEAITLDDGTRQPPNYGTQQVYGSSYKVYQGTLQNVMNAMTADKVPAHRIKTIYYDAGLTTNVGIVAI